MNVTVNVVEWEKREEDKQEACDFAPFSSLPIRGYLLSGPGLPSAVRWGLLGAWGCSGLGPGLTGNCLPLKNRKIQCEFRICH